MMTDNTNGKTAIILNKDLSHSAWWHQLDSESCLFASDKRRSRQVGESRYSGKYQQPLGWLGRDQSSYRYSDSDGFATQLDDH